MWQVALSCALMLVMNAASEECSTTEQVTKTISVYEGWPFRFFCPQIFYEVDYYDDEVFTDYTISTCIIKDVSRGVVLMNSTFNGSVSEIDFVDDEEQPLSYDFGNINKTTYKEYEVYLQRSSYCWIYKFTLQLLVLPTETCEENLNRTGMYPVSLSAGGYFEAICDLQVNAVPGKLIHKFKRNPGQNDAKAYWLYNCHEALPSNTRFLQSSQEYADINLYFNNISYEQNPGVYTCVIEHNNMKRYRIHHRACVRPTVSTQLSVKCNNATARNHDDVEIECFVDAGLGKESTISFSGRFNKLNRFGKIDPNEEDVACVAYVGTELSATDDRISCSLHQNKIENQCFYEIPTKEELDAHRTKVRMVYKIRNVKDSDFGTFQATIFRASRKEQAVFALTYDIGPGLKESHRLLIISLSTIGGVALLCLILWLACEIEIRWIWYKLFSPKEKERRRYSAYLAYYYNKDMSLTSPSELEGFVLNLNTRLKSIGGETFDRCRDPYTEQYTAECISAKLSECHRIVIILTPEYVNDHWGVYEAYEAWKAVIENKTKIIFILFPDAMDAIDKLPEELKITLKNALKRHNVIEWDGSLPFARRMRIQLELFMPKLPKHSAIELESSRLDYNCHISSVQNGYHGGVRAKDKNGNVCGENSV